MSASTRCRDVFPPHLNPPPGPPSVPRTCALPVGHEGDHERDGVTWANAQGGAYSPSAAGAPACADQCRRVVVDILEAQGADVHVSWAPPLFQTGYEPLDMTCPHGVLWFAEPTAEQRLKWAAEDPR